MTTAADAASASSRIGSGSARTSLRSAVRTSGVADDGAGHQEQGPGLVGGEAAEVGATTAEQLPPAVAALLGVDGHTGHRQGFEVASGRALGDLELLGDLGRGDAPLALEDEQEGDQPVGTHVRIFPPKPVRRWPVQGRMVLDMTNDTSTAPAPAAVAEGPDPRDLLARAMATAATTIRGVRPDQMELPTPCHDFDVRGLIAHLVCGPRPHRGHREPGRRLRGRRASEVLPDDGWASPLGRRGRTPSSTPGPTTTILDADRQVPWTVLPGREALAIYVNELTVHTWDLAQATDQQPGVGRRGASSSRCRRSTPSCPTRRARRCGRSSPGRCREGIPFDPPFADAVEVPADAPAIDRLVAWNGRRP